MSKGNAAQRPDRWSRKWPDRVAPLRNAGGFYRTAEGAGMRGGVPLSTANDAVVAAVRLAYKVAEAQIDRSARLAQRLRQAGDRAVGPGSDRKAVDATERLVMKAMMSGLAWWEASVAEGRCPIRRLAAAEYQMLGSILGLTPPSERKPRRARAPAEDLEDEELSGTREVHPPSPGASRKRLTIVHLAPEEDRLPIVVQNCEFASTKAVKTKVFLYNINASGGRPLEGEFRTASKGGDPRLSIRTNRDTARGLWRGAICDGDVQLGYIEIEL